MSTSKVTSRNRAGYWISSALNLLLWLAPIAIFLFLAIMEGTALYQQLALSTTVLVVIILTLVSLTTKYALRCRLWLFLIGIYICLQNIMTPIIVFAVCQVIDELVVCPLKNRFKRKLQTNKEIDKRL